MTNYYIFSGNDTLGHIVGDSYEYNYKLVSKENIRDEIHNTKDGFSNRVMRSSIINGKKSAEPEEFILHHLHGLNNDLPEDMIDLGDVKDVIFTNKLSRDEIEINEIKATELALRDLESKRSNAVSLIFFNIMIDLHDDLFKTPMAESGIGRNRYISNKSDDIKTRFASKQNTKDLMEFRTNLMNDMPNSMKNVVLNHTKTEQDPNLESLGVVFNKYSWTNTAEINHQEFCDDMHKVSFEDKVKFLAKEFDRNSLFKYLVAETFAVGREFGKKLGAIEAIKFGNEITVSASWAKQNTDYIADVYKLELKPLQNLKKTSSGIKR